MAGSRKLVRYTVSFEIMARDWKPDPQPKRFLLGDIKRILEGAGVKFTKSKIVEN